MSNPTNPDLGAGTWKNPVGWAGPPVGLALIDRWDYLGDSEEPPSYEGLEGGAAPMRIPRLWNMSLGALGGARQWGYPSFFWRLDLPPVPVVQISRGPNSVAFGKDAGRDRSYADTSYVPAIFIGWNPPSIGNK